MCHLQLKNLNLEMGKCIIEDLKTAQNNYFMCQSGFVILFRQVGS